MNGVFTWVTIIAAFVALWYAVKAFDGWAERHIDHHVDRALKVERPRTWQDDPIPPELVEDLNTLVAAMGSKGTAMGVRQGEHFAVFSDDDTATCSCGWAGHADAVNDHFTEVA